MFAAIVFILPENLIAFKQQNNEAQTTLTITGKSFLRQILIIDSHKKKKKTENSNHVTLSGKCQFLHSTPNNATCNGKEHDTKIEQRNALLDFWLQIIISL